MDIIQFIKTQGRERRERKERLAGRPNVPEDCGTAFRITVKTDFKEKEIFP